MPSIDDAIILAQNPSLLTFFHMSIHDAEQDQRQWLEKVLGVRMTPEQIHTWAGSIKSEKDKDGPIPTVIYMPLMSQMKGKEYYEALAKNVALPSGKKMAPNVYMGDYVPDAKEEIISLANQPKSDWMTFMSRTGVYSPEVMKHMADSRKKKESDPNHDIDQEMRDREREKNLSDVSKEEHIQNIRHAMGTAPVVSSKKDKDKE